MESTTTLANSTTVVSPGNCFPWEDYVETQKGDSAIGLVMFANCVATILANIVLFAVICSKKESRDQRCNMFMISIGCSDVLYALDVLVFCQPGLIQGRYIDVINKSVLACQGINILGTYLIAATWYSFLGLNIDRLYAIKRPIQFHSTIQSTKWARRSVAVCWIAALVPTVPLWFDTTIAETWSRGTDCKCFFPVSNRAYVGWASLTMALLPTAFIVLIWSAMAHHFITQPFNATSARLNLMKWVTIKMVGITFLFLMTIGPFCIAFTHTLLVTPTNTFALDLAFPLSLMNGPMQPIIYILAFSKLRKAFLQLFCCTRTDVLDAAVDAPLQLTLVTMDMKSSKTNIWRMPENVWSRGIL